MTDLGLSGWHENLKCPYIHASFSLFPFLILAVSDSFITFAD